MKARAWQKFFETQLRQHGKKLFSVAELANVAGVTPHVLNVEMARLVKQEVIVRYARGKYGLSGVAGPEDILPYLDRTAYITGFYALYRHNVVIQVPVVITCFTNRRHNRSRIKKTPAGTFVFSCVARKVFMPPHDGLLASPEQALLDWIYISLKEGVLPENQAALRNRKNLTKEKISRWRAKYPKSVLKKAETILSKV
jgi:hypothetical protein